MPKKQKPSLDATIRVPKALDRQIEKESFDLDLFKYEIVQSAWEAYKLPTGPRKRSAGATPYDGAVLEAIGALYRAKRTREIEAVLALLAAMAGSRGKG